jgi:hypothetical protein
MTSAEVAELSRRIDVGALRDYRDAVGRRTHEIATAFDGKDWEGRSRLGRLSALPRKAPSARAGSGMSRRSPAVPRDGIERRRFAPFVRPPWRGRNRAKRWRIRDRRLRRDRLGGKPLGRAAIVAGPPNHGIQPTGFRRGWMPAVRRTCQRSACHCPNKAWYHPGWSRRHDRRVEDSALWFGR